MLNFALKQSSNTYLRLRFSLLNTINTYLGLYICVLWEECLTLNAYQFNSIIFCILKIFKTRV